LQAADIVKMKTESRTIWNYIVKLPVIM